MIASPIPARVAAALSTEQFGAEFFDLARPVVLRGLGADWPALRRWGQREYLEAVCGGERSVLCEVNKQGRLFSYGSSDDSVHLPLRSVLDALSAAADEEPGAQQLYVAQTPVDELGSRLREGKCSSPLRTFFRSLTAAAAQT